VPFSSPTGSSAKSIEFHRLSGGGALLPAHTVEAGGDFGTSEPRRRICAAGSAAAAPYLAELAGCFGHLSKEDTSELTRRYTELQRPLQALMRA